ncbi:hypothetical protein K438DRAFT_1834178 [Mycena galopus ATCC 62051]|nr:hypothetical protein K438DRAFT_1834178 [Mycena galopus ATCC 62051]
MLPLSNIAALLSGVFAVHATPVKPAPDVGNVFAVSPGWDMSVLGLSEMECFQTCSKNATCVAYSFVPYETPTCFLKVAFDLATFQIRDFDVSVGLLGAYGTFSPVGPTSCFTMTP